MLKQFKVIYILHSPTKYGGANKSFLNMLEGLVSKGVIPFVVMPMHGGLCSELERRKIPYVLIPCYLSIYPPLRNIRDTVLFLPRLIRDSYINCSAIIKLIDYMQKLKPNIIHSNVGPIHIGYKVAKKLGIPHVWHIREYQGLDFGMHPLFSMKGFIRKLHAPNNYVIATTQRIHNYFLLNDYARVISNGVFKANCTQFKLDKHKYFLFAGRLEKNKGIRDLIVAFAEFTKAYSEYQLYIAGDTANIHYKNSLMSLVKKNGISEKTMFLGMRDDIGDLMAQATALIVPSLHEGFGRITAEAMFNGCLVIGNSTVGTKEILEKEDLGVLYSGHDELVAAMKKVALNGIESYFPLIKKAQARAVALYSVEQNVSTIYDFYQEILAKHAP